MGTLKVKVGTAYVPIPRGPKGDTGDTGQRGSKWFVSGQDGLMDYADVASPIEGDAFLYPNSGDVFYFDGAAWNWSGSIKGVTGDTGQTGPAGGVNSVDTLQGDVDLTGKYAQLSGAVFTGPVVLQKFAEKTASPVVAATTTLDCSQGMTHVVNLNQNTTLAVSNIDTTAGRASSVTVVLIQDATGGRVVTWPAGTKWPLGVAPVMTTTANAINVVTLISTDGGTTWLGFLAGADMK